MNLLKVLKTPILCLKLTLKWVYAILICPIMNTLIPNEEIEKDESVNIASEKVKSGLSEITLKQEIQDEVAPLYEIINSNLSSIHGIFKALISTEEILNHKVTELEEEMMDMQQLSLKVTVLQEEMADIQQLFLEIGLEIRELKDQNAMCKSCIENASHNIQSCFKNTERIWYGGQYITKGLREMLICKFCVLCRSSHHKLRNCSLYQESELNIEGSKCDYCLNQGISAFHKTLHCRGIAQHPQ